MDTKALLADALMYCCHRNDCPVMFRHGNFNDVCPFGGIYQCEDIRNTDWLRALEREQGRTKGEG